MSLFANGEEVNAWLIGLGTLLGGVLGAVGTLIVKIIQQRDISSESHRKIAAKERRDTIEEWQDWAAYQQAQSERKDAAIRDQQLAIEALQRENSTCREETAQLYTQVWYLTDALKRAYVSLKALGQDPGEVPTAPEMKHRSNESEFRTRQAAQSVQILQESEASKPVPPVVPVPAKD